MAALHQSSNNTTANKTAPRRRRGAVFYIHNFYIHTAGQPLAMLAGAAGCASLGKWSGGEMVGPEGFEPPTKAL